MSYEDESPEARKAMLHSYHDVPNEKRLRAMSYLELAEQLQACKDGSPKFREIDREMKWRLAQDQAKINRSNILLGVCIGGVFSLLGGLLCFYLRSQ